MLQAAISVRACPRGRAHQVRMSVPYLALSLGRLTSDDCGVVLSGSLPLLPHVEVDAFHAVSCSPGCSESRT